MIHTFDFKTKSEIITRKFPRVNGNNQYKSKTVVALDGGYSSVKGVSPNKLFIFPSYAKLAPDGLEIIGKINEDDLQLRNDETGEVWLVGRTAENLIDQADISSTTDTSLYTRYRYDSPIFKAIMLTGIGLGLIGTGKTDEVFLQTGLPSEYRDRDSLKLKKALAGDYRISIRVGNSPWYALSFSLPVENIDVIEQPQGTLCSCVYKDGAISHEGNKILRSKGTLILDIGFGTEDIFSARSGFKNNHQTFSDTGMRAVFERTIEMMKKAYKDKDIYLETKVFELQSSLSSGVLSYFDPETFSTTPIPYSEYLEKANEELCDKSIRRLMQEYNNLAGYEYLIVTGGTGESRFEQIRNMLSGISELNILPGNLHTPDLSYTYSNVLGYYMFRHAQIAAEYRKLTNSKE